MRLLFFFFLLFLSLRSFAAGITRVVDVRIAGCEKVLESFGRYRRLMEFADPGGDWPADLLVNTDGFQQWAASRHRSTSREVPGKLVAEYLEWFHQTKIDHPQVLEAQKEQAMREALGAIGVYVEPHQTSFEVLTSLSKNNVERIVSKIPRQKYTHFDSEIALVEKLRLVPSHNTSGPVGGFRSPLLSARQMRGLGQVSLNQSLFNSEFLKVEDQVFFYAYFGSQSQTHIKLDEKITQIYGENQGRLNHDFAEAHAWVSPFIMYPVDLVHIATQLKGLEGGPSPKELREFLEIYGLNEIKVSVNARALVALLMEQGVFLKTPEYQAMLRDFRLPEPHDRRSIQRLAESFENQLDSNAAILEGAGFDFSKNWQPVYLQSPKSWDRMLPLTKGYQFRVTDFETLVKKQLLSQLWKYKHSSEAHHHTLYHLALETLQKGNSHALQVLLRSWVYEPLGLPGEYEVKVPVALDARFLE